MPAQQEAQPNSGAPGPLDSLRNHPQFQQLKMLVQQNPQILHPVMQQLGASNPQILQLINQHQEEFIRLLNEPVDFASLGGGAGGMGAGMGAGMGGGMGGGAGGGMGGMPQAPPGAQMIQVTQEEKEAIDRVSIFFSFLFFPPPPFSFLSPFSFLFSLFSSRLTNFLADKHNGS